MKQYFLLQCKRACKALPGMLAVVLVLLLGLLITVNTLDSQNTEAADSKFQVALCGTAQDQFLQLGMAALKSFDSTRFAMDVLDMTEPEAAAALARGDIAAYVVIPENFSQEAAYGNILPLKFVSTTGAVSMVSMFKEEITDVITHIVMESQRCVYGMGNAADAAGLQRIGHLMTEMAIEYAEFVFVRGNTYRVSILGISDGLTMGQYLLAGLSVLFLLLGCLPFAPLAVKNDLSLQRMLAPKGMGAFRQILCEYAGFLLVYVAVLTGAVLLLKPWLPDISLLTALPVAVMSASLSFLLFSVSTDLISGVVLQFVTALALCFIAGCMYPISFFPEPVQALSRLLPTGIARELMAGAITGEGAPMQAAMLLMCSVGCVLLTALLRGQALKRR